MNKAVAPAIPNNTAAQGITIPHIAPADNPLSFLLWITVEFLISIVDDKSGVVVSIRINCDISSGVDT